MKKSSKRYHLLISDAGKDLICIFETNVQFTDIQKEGLIQLYGDYVVTKIDSIRVDCLKRLDVITDIDHFISLEESKKFYSSKQ